MKKILLPSFILLFSSLSSAQHDSTAIGRIRISKPRDTVYIKVLTDWKISRRAGLPAGPYTSVSKEDYKYVSLSPSNYERLTVIAPAPKRAKDDFDLEKYFMDHPETKSVRLVNGRTDAVTFFVTVNKLGRLRFVDSQPVEKISGVYVVYDDGLKTKYKIDAVHVRTQKAFRELSRKRWRSARIKELKKHPSKHKWKYRRYRGVSKGTIRIIYSSTPFLD